MQPTLPSLNQTGEMVIELQQLNKYLPSHYVSSVGVKMFIFHPQFT